MVDIFIVLVEESNVEETNRDVQVFSSLQGCSSFLAKKIKIYKSYEWPEDLRPPEAPTVAELQSLPAEEIHTVYEFEHQTVHHDFFCITLFVKKTKLV
jgi:hypothetical protein